MLEFNSVSDAVDYYIQQKYITHEEYYVLESCVVTRGDRAEIKRLDRAIKARSVIRH